MTKMLIMLLWLLLLGLATCSSLQKLRPIHIGLAIDDHSLKDLVILINSVVESALEPDDLVFHIVACGKDMMDAMVLKKTIATSISNCLSTINFELVAFMLPPESGFAQQLVHLKKKSNHWNSQSGADMVRFFMPSIFGHVERILYLDNDIIVSCCLEEIWDTPFEAHQIVGIALDDLNWATVTQFKRHYNASHPLVIKNMRRDQPAEAQYRKISDPISTKEFSAALPRYPNDGVLLIDTVKYNKMKILETMNEIALANAQGDYVVNLGTQQFTVLALYDRWKELSPRANLRHFPDMARGYLMWFYYNGFIHYAGQHKPKLLCQTTTADNAAGRVPYLRVMSYMAWALSNYQVYTKCPNDHIAYVPDCLPHVHRVNTLTELYAMILKIISVSADTSLLYLHVGQLHGDLSHDTYCKSSVFGMPYFKPEYQFVTNGTSGSSASSGGVTADPSSNSNSNSKSSSGHKSKSAKTKHHSQSSQSSQPPEDLVDTIARMMLHNVTWSVRVYDYKVSRVEHSAAALSKAGFTLINPGEISKAPAKKKGKKEVPVRTIAAQVKHFCDSEKSPYKRSAQQKNATTSSDAVTVSDSSSSSGASAAKGTCELLLPEIKSEGRAHWDAQLIVIDVNSPHTFMLLPSTAGAKLSDAARAADEAHPPVISKHSSLGVLLKLDLVFMRPKLIVVRLAAGSVGKLSNDVALAHRFLKQSGYLTGEHRGRECGEDINVRLSHHDTSASSGSGTSNGAGGATASASASSTGASASGSTAAAGVSYAAATVRYACVWGLRVSDFEFYPGLLT